jgi:hypothetical protein
LGVPFNNLRGTGSEAWTLRNSERGHYGSPCNKGYLKSNTEFTELPICTASRLFQVHKLNEIDRMEVTDATKTELKQAVTEKVCLCDHLGNGALINLGIARKGATPQAICPGPNIAWFNREYTLREMVDHIYGRGASLVSADRPHMFCQELELYVNYFENLLQTSDNTPAHMKYLDTFRDNLEEGMSLCEDIATGKAYPHENLRSIPAFIRGQRERLRSMQPALSLVRAAVA